MSPKPHHFFRLVPVVLGASAAALVAACGDTVEPSVENPPPASSLPSTYAFESRFAPGESSVAYNGQILRHVLIADLKKYIGELSARIVDGDFAAAPDLHDAVRGSLDFYYAFDTTAAAPALEVGILATEGPMPPAQLTYGQVASPGANLKSKMAGNDEPTKQHKDWATQFTGWQTWDAGFAHSPDGLVEMWLEQIATMAIAHANNSQPDDPTQPGIKLSKAFVTASGLDLQQLLQKFLDGAVTYSQATDDYWDEALAVDNTEADGGTKPYTKLEHHWDEGFGYFGAARDYGDYSDDEIASSAVRDTNADGSIDFLREKCFGHSTNAAKRDVGSNAAARTDFTAEAWDALRRGRDLISRAGGDLDATQTAELHAARDAASLAWEKAIAASAVHYINEVVVMMDLEGTSGYSFLTHAKAWSEMKGFMLSLQFNPRRLLDDAAFASLHDLVGDAPVLPGAAGFADYRADLLAARTLLGDTYTFAAANLGDDNGEGGW